MKNFNSWKSDQNKDCSAAQQQRNRHDSNKILEYMDSGKTFEVNFVTLHSLDLGNVAQKSGNVDMQQNYDKTFLKKWLVTRFQTYKSYHAVAPCQGPIRYSDTVSVDPLLLFQQLINIG